MLKNTDKAWEMWGSKEPYFAVITYPKFRINNLNSEALHDFFSSGEQHINHVLNVVREQLNSNFSPKKAIDFGCGTGRLVIPLAKICNEVVGIDVSQSMLKETKKNCDAQSLYNVKFIKSDDELSQLLGSYDFIHSFIVFQHIPVNRGEKIISNLINHLSPLGVGVFHLTYNRNTSRLHKAVHWFRRNIPLFHNLINVVQGKNFSEPMIQMNQYNLNRIFHIFQENGIKNVFSEFTCHGSVHEGMIFYFSK